MSQSRKDFLEDLKGALFKYFKEDSAAVACVVAYYNMAQTVVVSMRPDSDRKDVAMGVVTMAVDHAFGLPQNPFWQQHAAKLEPVWAAVFMSWLDAPRFMEMDDQVSEDDVERKMESRMRVVHALNMIHTIAVTALGLSQPKTALDDSAKLLNDLMDLSSKRA